jgi:hypothetical protein
MRVCLEDSGTSNDSVLEVSFVPPAIPGFFVPPFWSLFLGGGGGRGGEDWLVLWIVINKNISNFFMSHHQPPAIIFFQFSDTKNLDVFSEEIGKNKNQFFFKACPNFPKKRKHLWKNIH